MDPLTILYYQLARQTEVPSVNEYADQFQLLGDEFEAEGQRGMADVCHGKAQQYIELAKWMPDMKRTQQSGFVLLERLHA